MKSHLKSLYYAALDAATAGHGLRRTIGGQQVRFPARWSRYYPEDYEPATFSFLRSHCLPGRTVMDIGAHLGLFSVIMARLVGAHGRVFSFEPDPQIRAQLEQIVDLNNCRSVVQVCGEAMTQRSGTACFYHTGDIGSNANSLVKTHRSRAQSIVATTSLDDFVQPSLLPVACLKIDVEGAELDLLRGASSTFLRCRPVAFLSLHPAALGQAGGSLHDVWDLLRSYRMSVLLGETPCSEAAFCDATDLFDVVLLPS